jgi:hypothetical protein
MNKNYLLLVLSAVMIAGTWYVHAGEREKPRFIHVTFTKPELKELKLDQQEKTAISATYHYIAGILCTDKTFKFLYEKDKPTNQIVLSQDIQRFTTPQSHQYFQNFNEKNQECLRMVHLAQAMIHTWNADEFRSRDKFLNLLSKKETAINQSLSSKVQKQDDGWETVGKKEKKR